MSAAGVTQDGVSVWNKDIVAESCRRRDVERGDCWQEMTESHVHVCECALARTGVFTNVFFFCMCVCARVCVCSHFYKASLFAFENVLVKHKA